MEIRKDLIMQTKEKLFQRYVDTLTTEYNDFAKEYNAKKKFWQRKKPQHSREEVMKVISKHDWSIGFNDATLLFLDILQQEGIIE